MPIKELANGRSRRFLNRLRRGAARVARWISRIGCCVAASRSDESTAETSDDVQQEIHLETVAAMSVETDFAPPVTKRLSDTHSARQVAQEELTLVDTELLEKTIERNEFETGVSMKETKV